MNAEYTVPMIARVDGVWRPVWGQVIELGSRLAAKYILNGKVHLEVKPGNWRNFNQTTTRSQLKVLAIKYNLNDLDSDIRAKNAKEREEKFPGVARTTLSDEIGRIGQWIRRPRRLITTRNT